jgi:hypothetical protein
MADDEINQRLDRIETALAGLATKTDISTLSDRLGRQVAVTEALRSELRMMNGLMRSILVAVQSLAGGYADLSGRVTDLENPAPDA